MCGNCFPAAAMQRPAPTLFGGVIPLWLTRQARTSLCLTCPVCSALAWEAALVLAAAPELARLASSCEATRPTAISISTSLSV